MGHPGKQRRGTSRSSGSARHAQEGPRGGPVGRQPLGCLIAAPRAGTGVASCPGSRALAASSGRRAARIGAGVSFLPGACTPRHRGHVEACLRGKAGHCAARARPGPLRALALACRTGEPAGRAHEHEGPAAASILQCHSLRCGWRQLASTDCAGAAPSGRRLCPEPTEAHAGRGPVDRRDCHAAAWCPAGVG